MPGITGKNFDVARTFDHTDFSEDLPVRDLRKALSNIAICRC